MKKLLGSLIVLAAIALPALAQAPPMSPDDQANASRSIDSAR